MHCSVRDYQEVLLLVSGVADAAIVCSGYDVNRLGPSQAVLQYGSALLEEARQAEMDAKHMAALATEQALKAAQSLDTICLLASGWLVMFMQAGFALLCAGSVRSKNTINMLLKNILDACVSTIAYFLIGFHLSFDHHSHPSAHSGFIGTWRSALAGLPQPASSEIDLWAMAFFEWSFCAVAVTIVAGAVAERTTCASYVIYSFLMSALVYPISCYWVWSKQGWLAAAREGPRLLGCGVIDFAGAGVVHVAGGVAGLVAAWVAGPRRERFDKQGRAMAIRGHSTTLVVLGALVLWFGFYGFNVGSTLKFATPRQATIAGRIAVTTTMAAALGALGGLLVEWWHLGTWDISGVCNGLICGLVTITASCSVVQPWAAAIEGLAAPVVFHYLADALIQRQVDDPLNTFAMHAGCGVLGLIAAGVFAEPALVAEVYGVDPPPGGLAYGAGGQLIAAQAIGGMCIAAWTGGNMLVLFLTMKKLGWLDVDDAEQEMGLDAAQHGGAAYEQQQPLPAMSRRMKTASRKLQAALRATMSIKTKTAVAAASRSLTCRLSLLLFRGVGEGADGVEPKAEAVEEVEWVGRPGELQQAQASERVVEQGGRGRRSEDRVACRELPAESMGVETKAGPGAAQGGAVQY